VVRVLRLPLNLSGRRQPEAQRYRRTQPRPHRPPRHSRPPRQPQQRLRGRQHLSDLLPRARDSMRNPSSGLPTRGIFGAFLPLVNLIPGEFLTSFDCDVKRDITAQPYVRCSTSASLPAPTSLRERTFSLKQPKEADIIFERNAAPDARNQTMTTTTPAQRLFVAAAKSFCFTACQGRQAGSQSRAAHLSVICIVRRSFAVVVVVAASFDARFPRVCPCARWPCVHLSTRLRLPAPERRIRCCLASFDDKLVWNAAAAFQYMS